MERKPLDLSNQVLRIERKDGSLVKLVERETEGHPSVGNILDQAKIHQTNSSAGSADEPLQNLEAQRAAALIAFSMARVDGDTSFKEVSEIVRWFREDAKMEFPELVQLLIEVSRGALPSATLQSAVENFVNHMPTDKWYSFFDLLGNIEIADGISHRQEREFHKSFLSGMERCIAASSRNAN